MLNIRKDLEKMTNNSNIDFVIKLTPGLNKNEVLGIKNPILREYAKKIKDSKEAIEFIKDLPHKYHDENILHSLLLNEYIDFKEYKQDIIKFLPYVNNWIVCDILSPKKIFKKYKKELIELLISLSKSRKVYTIRYSVELMMNFYLDNEFKEDYIQIVTSIKSDEYYVNMGIAWYMADALVKQYNTAIKYIESKKLNKFTHNKSIQKAIESFRIDNKKKEYLRSLKIKE